MLDRKIAVFGLSANPPHCGHQAICLWLREALNVKGIYVVPTYQHMFGKQLESFDHRVEMCNIMTLPLTNTYVKTTEALLPFPSSTFNLLEHYKSERLDNLVFVMGSDCLTDITKWHRWAEIPSLAKILVLDRPGSESAVAPFPVMRYNLNGAPTSSSIIRERLARGESVEGLIPYRVERYIRKHGLYGVK